MKPLHPAFPARVVSVMLMMIVLAPIRMQAQSQDPPPSDFRKMQSKIDQLEQELRDLKGQLSTMQAAQKSAVTPTPQESASLVTNQEATAKPEEKPKSAGNTLDFYGFVMLDSGYQFRTNDPNWFDVVRPTKLPSGAGEFAPDGKVFYGVRQTRFGVKSTTPTHFGDLKTIFEFELFGTGIDAGQTTFRLRHAYGELGHFGAGQTWSPFMDPDVFNYSCQRVGESAARAD